MGGTEGILICYGWDKKVILAVPNEQDYPYNVFNKFIMHFRITCKENEDFFLQALDEDGFAAPGLIIRNHDIYVNKQTPRNTKRDSGAHLTDR